MSENGSARKSYDGVVVCAPVTVPYRRFSTNSAHWWIGRALRELTKAAGLRPRDLDGLSVSSFTVGPDTAVGLTQHFGLSPRWLDHVPFGGASAIVALRRAARAVQAGDADFVACVAGDTNHVDSFRKTLSTFSRFAQDAVYPYGAGGANASFALITKNYMNAYGATREDFGRICVAQRDNALAFPHALMKKPLTLDEYMSARAIADPIHLFDCVMPCAGAEVFLVCREDAARSLGLKAARLLSTIERHNAFPDDVIQSRGGWAVDMAELWSMAGVRPDDVDLLETYDDYPVIVMMQFEDLGFCRKGEGPDFVRSHKLTVDGTFPHNTSGGQLSVGQAGAAGGYLGLVEAMRQLAGTTLGAAVADAEIAAVSGFGMINYDRGLSSCAAILGEGGMTRPLQPPKRKNPLKKTRLPLAPQATRSRAAHGLTAAAAEGRFALQVCEDCGAVIYPPRDACPSCLSARLPFRDIDPSGRLVAETTVRISTDPYFRERTPWRVGAVKLDAGPVIVAHLHDDTVEGRPVRLALKLDKSGGPVVLAMPAQETPHMQDDPQLREMTCDPKFRRVLITDGRTPVGQAMAKAFSDAGAAIVFVGVADPWKPFAGMEALRAMERVEIVPLDVTDSESVNEQAQQNGGRIDIIVNTAEHTRVGGIVERQGITIARDEMDVRYFGLMRLAQAFGPALRFRGADGANSATAFVNLLSVHALANWPAYGAHSAVEAACLSAAQCLRAELRPGGVKVLNAFFGPLETEWFQTVPPPKVAPAVLARAVVDALKKGLEDVFVGDVAEDVRARLAVNPKALERELAS